MDKSTLLLEIRTYFQLIIEEKYLFKNPECLGLVLDLIDDLVDIDPRFSLVLDNVGFIELSEELLEKILLRFKQYDNQMNKFRKIN